MAAQIDNPYVGPRTFKEEDSAFFYGRDAESRNLLALILSQRLVLFYAQSGAGKSSLINAKLIPALKQEGFFILPKVRVSGQLPEGIQQVKNIFTFNVLLNMEERSSETEKLDSLANMSLFDYLHTHHLPPAHMQNESDEEVARILIIDQFEEIVTTHLDRWREREAFFYQLREALVKDPLLWVLLAMREDHVAALEPYAPILPGKLRTRFHMGRMRAAAASAAVATPAATAGRPFAEGVAEQLIDNLRQVRSESDPAVRYGEFVEPVQLQVVCRQLWENLKQQPAAEISAENLRELGKIDVALADFYETAVNAAVTGSKETEFAIRNWFERKLITEAGTRGTVYQGSEKTAGLDNTAVHILANQYLLRAENRAGGIWYELVHDRFVMPIIQANVEWRKKQNPLLQAAEKWKLSGHDTALLFHGVQLQQILSTIKDEDQEPLVREFLQASSELQNRYALEEAESRIETERLRAEVEHQRAEEERREANILRAITVGLVIMVLIAIVSTFSAFDQRNLARANLATALAIETVANDNANIANANASVADANATVAGINAGTAVANATIAAQYAQNASENKAEALEQAIIAATSEVAALENAAIAQTRLAQVDSNAVNAADAFATKDAEIEEMVATLTAVSPSFNFFTDDDSLDISTPQPTTVRDAPVEIETITIGTTVNGEPIEGVRYGSGENVIVLVGGMHAGFAPSTVEVAEQAITYFNTNADNLPESTTLYIIPEINIDSPQAAGRLEGRLNAHGVDLNRNWDCNWVEDASWSGIVVPGSGGNAPFSEPESESLASFLIDVDPKAVVVWYARATGGLASAGGCGTRSKVSGELSEIYGNAAGYRITDHTNYVGVAAGDATNWLDEQGIPAVSILLPSYESTDWQNSLAGINAVIAAHAQ